MKIAKKPLTVLAIAAPLLLLAGLAQAVMQARDEPVVAGLTDGYVSSLDEAPPGTSVASDTFGGSQLESLWTPIDVGTSDSIAVGQGTVRLRSETGEPNEAWGVLSRPRIAQQIDNEDFAVDVRFLAMPDTPGQNAGLTFETDDRNWVGFEMSFDGRLRLSALRTENGESAVRLLDGAIGASDSITLRVTRRGLNWSFEYSLDGTTFNALGSFDHEIDIAQIAIGAGSVAPDDESSVPGAFLRVTSFTNLAETGLAVSGGPAVEINVIGPGAYTLSPPLSELQLGDNLTIEAVAGENAVFESWEGTGTADGTTYVVEVNGDLQVTATFEDLQPLPVLDVWYGDDQTFGANGITQTWVNILGNLTDRDGIARFTYTLNDGAPQNLSLGPDGQRLADLGDFNAEIAFQDLEPGDNTVVLEAIDSVGNTTTETVNVTRADTPDPISDRTYTWEGVENPTEVVHIADGKWAVDGDQLVTVEPDFDRAFIIGDETWINYEVSVEITPRELDVNAYQELSGSPRLFLAGGWRGHVDWTGKQPNTGYWPIGAFAVWHWSPEEQLFLEGNERKVTDTTPRPPPQFDTTYIFKLRAEEVEVGGAAAVEYSFKVFVKGTDEPDDWEVSIVDSSGPQSGSILISAHHVDAAFGEITIDAL